MLLSELAAVLREDGLLLKECGEAEITAITFDSRKVVPGTLFTCKGARFKEEYLTQASESGAVAYLSETEYAAELPCLIVSDIRKAMSLIALAFYGNPAAAMDMVGITATKGKTTTTYFLTNIFNEFTRSENGSIATVEVHTGKGVKKAVLTTPEAYDLQETLAEIRGNGVRFCTMEVSSQGLKVDRVYGMRYNVGICLNIDDDHISPNEHPDWTDYYMSKLKLFALSDLAVVNGEDPHAKGTGLPGVPGIIEAARAGAKQVYTYGRSDEFDYYLTNHRRADGYQCFDVVGPGLDHETFRIKMLGSFNCDNALAAIITAKHFGVDNDSIRRGLEKTHVPGRMDLFYNAERDVYVLVDFAHNKLSFTNLFKAIREEFPDRRMVVAIGSAGGKGFQRRKAIGEVLTQYADYAYLTDCDSNWEPTEDICNEILSHVGPDGPECTVILDREEAIATALLAARPGDIIPCVARGEEIRHWINGQILDCIPDTELARMYAAGEYDKLEALLEDKKKGNRSYTPKA